MTGIPYHNVWMIRQDLDGIPCHELPAGFSMAWYRPGDATAWTEIHLLAYAGDPVKITPDLHSRQFGTDESLLSQRQLFIEAPGGAKIATATAWFNSDYFGEHVGLVHWVAVAPAWQGRGLAKPLLRAVLLRMRELGHSKAMLTTQSTRTAAIRLYLQFGFEMDERKAGC